MSANQPRNVRHQFRCPPELEGGVYANMVGVWHTSHEFTIDFAASMPPQQTKNDAGETVVVVPQKVTARVKVPPTVLFEIVRALNENLTKYEDKFGDVRRPGNANEPLVPPDDWGSGTPGNEPEGDGKQQDD